jgi:hypothetical protein
LPSGPSNSYCFSTASHGIRRRWAVSASRARVNSFSFTSSCWRAASHSSGDTIGGAFMADSSRVFLSITTVRPRSRGTRRADGTMTGGAAELTQGVRPSRVMRGPRFLVRKPDLVDLDHRCAVRQRLEGHGHDRVPEPGRGRGPGEDQTTGSVDLPVGAGVQDRGFVVDHDDAGVPPTCGSVSARVSRTPDGLSHDPRLSASSHASKRSSAGAAISRRTVTEYSSVTTISQGCRGR